MEVKYFEGSDGWLFATLKIIKKAKLYLPVLLSIGDTLNHSIFTLEEINNGLSRLESEGYIEFANGKMYLTDKAKVFIKSNHKRFELCIAEQIRYSNIFKEMPLQFETIYKEYFSQAEYEEAIKKVCN